MTPVLPVPAPASTRMSSPRASIAAACSGVGERRSLTAAPQSSLVVLVGHRRRPVAAADRRELAEGRADVVTAQPGARPGVAADLAAAHAGDDRAGARAGFGQHLVELLAVEQIVRVEVVGGELR